MSEEKKQETEVYYCPYHNKACNKNCMAWEVIRGDENGRGYCELISKAISPRVGR